MAINRCKNVWQGHGPSIPIFTVDCHGFLLDGHVFPTQIGRTNQKPTNKTMSQSSCKISDPRSVPNQAFWKGNCPSGPTKTQPPICQNRFPNPRDLSCLFFVWILPTPVSWDLLTNNKKTETWSCENSIPMYIDIATNSDSLFPIRFYSYNSAVSWKRRPNFLSKRKINLPMT